MGQTMYTQGVTPATAERFYTLPEFLSRLGIARRTYEKYRFGGVLPEPPKQGKRSVFTEDYLAACQKAWRAYKSET